ncbi:hypothetical protein CDD80_1697 [Ophiocordyceps camponoti-rufipedis]|uniref:Enoyl reductase (ER) domain-containing protein n=1 Tax=Ophiocordyceps camponoti-rufipedis TaxID=2004952 RepID=A0A2C5YDU1_9HYPO|nr:hypothetical protein CDD80_1697 [Ophiocordyceps camponoti-rufipedis]
MRAIVINKYVEKPSDLTATTAPDPSPKPGEYTIQIHAAAANFFDILQIQGRYQTQPPFPWVAGVEFAGTVLSVPPSPSPSSFQVGDRVFGGTQDRKLAVARSYGAHHAVSYTSPDWPSRVKQLTPNQRGVDIVFDPVGLVDASTKCTAWNGRILVVGFAAGAIEKVPVNKVLLKNIALVGIFWGAYAVNQPEVVPQVWHGVMRLISEGKLRPTVYQDDGFAGLDSVKDALSALASRRTWGKVVITIPPPQETSRL